MSTHYTIIVSPVLIRYDKISGLITDFMNRTGLSMIETDGPYGGGACGSMSHDHHVGTDDGIYWQNRLQVCADE